MNGKVMTIGMIKETYEAVGVPSAVHLAEPDPRPDEPI